MNGGWAANSKSEIRNSKCFARVGQLHIPKSQFLIRYCSEATGATLCAMASRALRIGMSLLLMVVLLGVFLWNVDFAEVGRSITGAKPLLLIAAVSVALLSYWLRALRWQFILLPVGRVRHTSVVLTTAVGYAALSLLPARMGDLIRPILLARRERIPRDYLLSLLH